MTSKTLHDALVTRFGASGRTAADASSVNPSGFVEQLSQRGSCRQFDDTQIPLETLRLLAATALSAPTKSDLQQCDIIFIQDADKRARIDTLIDGEGWAHKAPALAIFCGNNRRQRLIHEWQDLPFMNDHLDAFFNASVDAAIVLTAFTLAAESTGLGCCPVSAVRNEPEQISEILDLPDHVFPVAGLAIGWPSAPAPISQRLPLDVTVHVDSYSEGKLRETVADYDSSREAAQPYANRRNDASHPDRQGPYGWSEDKTRQYSLPERATFGTFIKSKGFFLK